MTTGKSRTTDEKAQFRESLERNRRKLESWPEWMRQGSVGERAVRETASEANKRAHRDDSK
ncbi:hypothetical protein [Hyalangium versicolor]|uniref:hypothetical protein n=1 Tax=Hyalangium versicolor TaxID=2861190 RepID=UPI001CCC2470|nr:hypothetical protein [Hyalangium versicolor]